MPRRVRDAKKAMKGFHIALLPQVEDLKYMLRQNLIKNCPIMAEHEIDAKDIFGPSISRLQDNSTRKQPA